MPQIGPRTDNNDLPKPLVIGTIICGKTLSQPLNFK